MSRKEDTQVLVHAVNSKNGISQKAFIACLVFGIAFLSLLIYGFIIALDLKSSPPPYIPDANLAGEEAKPCPDVEFDYLLLSLRWPLSACTEGQCVPEVPSRWLVHGLWPNYANGSWPEFCCPSTPFEEDPLQPLRPRLLDVWPNLLKRENATSLWGHEWTKHGTCSTKNPKIRGELNYFNHTLSLFDDVHVKKWLQSGDIVPGAKKIRKERIKNLLATEFGKKVTVHCVSEGLTRSGSSTTTSTTAPSSSAENKKLMNLGELHFCYDKTEITAIDCPDHDNCPDEFLLPSKV